jgi:hypothetical protein
MAEGHASWRFVTSFRGEARHAHCGVVVVVVVAAAVVVVVAVVVDVRNPVDREASLSCTHRGGFAPAPSQLLHHHCHHCHHDVAAVVVAAAAAVSRLEHGLWSGVGHLWEDSGCGCEDGSRGRGRTLAMPDGAVCPYASNRRHVHCARVVSDARAHHCCHGVQLQRALLVTSRHWRHRPHAGSAQTPL